MSTHNICFLGEIRKMFICSALDKGMMQRVFYPLLLRSMLKATSISVVYKFLIFYEKKEEKHLEM